MYRKLLIEGIVALSMLSNISEAKGETILDNIRLNPSTYTLDFVLEPVKDLKVSCETKYNYNLGKNGRCFVNYDKNLGFGVLEVRANKDLLSSSYFLGVVYRIRF